jgi:hypothetical protein
MPLALRGRQVCGGQQTSATAAPRRLSVQKRFRLLTYGISGKEQETKC